MRRRSGAGGDTYYDLAKRNWRNCIIKVGCDVFPDCSPLLSSDFAVYKADALGSI
jgi:hypothetical protein